MNKDPGIVLLAEENSEFGIYNMLSSFFQGLMEGFEKESIKAEWANKFNPLPYLSISFNTAGSDHWNKLLSSGCAHLMWTVDSCFYHNFGIIKEFQKHPNFHIVGITKDDVAPLKYFFPEFKNYHYLPLAANPEVWKYENEEKDLNIVYLSSLQNPDNIITEVKNKLPQNLFDGFMYMLNFLKNNPHHNIWEIHKELFELSENISPEDKEQNSLIFNYFFQNLTYALSYSKRIELVKSLEDVGVKVWGNEAWIPYISGKNEYMGAANFSEATKILARSKVSLNIQPTQILNGIHDRILNSSLTESTVLCDSPKEVKTNFGDSLTYFDIKNFSDIKQKALLLLSNEEIRKHKAQKAKEIVLKNHTWTSRAKTINELTQHLKTTSTPV